MAVDEGRTAWWDAANEVGSGRQFAERVREERKQRGWSQAELARRMRELGQPLDQAAVSKIESPPDSDRFRRIDIDEAIAFARVFGRSLEEMTLPAVKAHELEVLKVLAAGSHLAHDLHNAEGRLWWGALAVALGVEVYPEVRARYEERMRDLRENPPGADPRLERRHELRFLERVEEARHDTERGVPHIRAEQLDLEGQAAALAMIVNRGGGRAHD